MTVMDHIYADIPGWFDFHDTYARWIAEVPDGGTIVEVGVFCGKSFAFLGVEAINSGKRLALHAVDPWTGSPELMQFAAVRDGSFYDAWLMTKARLVALGADVTEHKRPSVEAAATFADGSVDRVWLDGDHSTAGLLADLRAWWPKVKPGGEIGGHDFGSFGVKDAVDQFTESRGLAFEVLQPHASAGTNSARSFLIRKPAPVTTWAVPDGQRSVLICPVSNHPFVARQTTASLGALMLYAREHGTAAGFQVEYHWESEAFCLDTLRDRAALRAVRDGFSHLLFLDADNVWPHDLLTRLLPQHDLGIVGGLYHGKAVPHNPIALRTSIDNPAMFTHMPHIHEERFPVEVDALGMGCTLIPVELFRQVPRPWFKFQVNEYGWNRVTEDIWFCRQARAAGCRMFIDPTINVGHVAHVVVGVNNYLPHVASVEKAHREKARQVEMRAIRAAEGSA